MANNIIQVKIVTQLVKKNIREKEPVIIIVQIKNIKIATAQVNRSSVRDIVKKK